MTLLQKLIDQAKAIGGTVVETPSAAILVLPREREPIAATFSIDEAAAFSKASPRVVRSAIRAGKLLASGSQRTRVIARADLDAWIASRRVLVPDADDDLEARVAEIAGGAS